MSLSNRKYDQILKEYKKRQSDNRLLQENRRREIYKLIPEFQNCDNQIVDLSIAQAKKLVSGQTASSSELRSEISKISSRKESLLLQHGFSADYLNPIFQCPDCRDTGYIENQKCHCLKQRLIEVLYEQSNIRNILETENFDNFSYAYYEGKEVERMQKVVCDSKIFIENFKDDYQNLLFYGNVGCGKTFISNCIAKSLIDRGFSVVYFTAFQLFDLLAKNTFEGKDQPTDIKELHDDIFDCDLLIIDDLGTESSNSFTKSQLFLILNERNCRKKSTIISSNLSLEKIGDIYSERSLSRILGNYNVYKFMGKDIRVIKMKRNNQVNDRL